MRQIFETDGEPAFRELETAALAEALAEPEPLVIAAAGGVLLRAENREALRRSGAQRRLAARRPGTCSPSGRPGGHRPLLDGDPIARCAACSPTASRCTGPRPTS